MKKEKSASTVEDQKLVREMVAGDRTAFNKFYKKYKPIVAYAVFKKVGNDKLLSEDLTMEILEKIYVNLAKYNDEYSVAAWVTKIANNHIIDYFRGNGKEAMTVSLSVPAHTDEEGATSVFEIPCGTRNPEAKSIANERKALVNQAIEQLDQATKEIVKLRYSQEMDYQEISDMLNMPLGTVKSILFRAHQRLRPILENYGLSAVSA